MSWLIPEITVAHKRTAGKLLSWGVSSAGALALAGWVLDIGPLKSLACAGAPMELSTAVTFILSGATLYFIIRAREAGDDGAQVALPMISLSIFLLMGVIGFTSILGIQIGVEHFLIDELSGAAPSAAPGEPSHAAMAAFLLVGAAGFLTVLDPEGSPRTRCGIGWTVGGIGAAAILGRAAGIPQLHILAFPSAALFLLLGLGLRCP